MRKSIIVGILCLAVFLAAYVGGIIIAVPQTMSHTTGTDAKNVSPTGDKGGSRKPFVRLCGDEGGPGKPFTLNNETGL